MAFKFVTILAFITVVRAGVIPSSGIAYSAPASLVKAAPVTYAVPAAYSGYGLPAKSVQQVEYSQQQAQVQTAAAVKAQRVLTKASDEYDPHPQYKFGYDVQDTLSGDSKTQVETRDGDVVQGEYSLIDADGYKRTVQYTADPVNGFNAVVSREPINVAAKTVAAPTTAKIVAPLAYAAAPATYASGTLQVSHAVPSSVANDAGPVVKGAYAASPIVKAIPVAYPISPEH